MSKKRIAIFIDSQKKSGGVYHEILNTIEKIKKYNSDNLKFSIIVSSKKLDINLEKENIELHYFSMNALERYICYLRNYGTLISRLKRLFFFQNKFENFLKKINVDVVYFPSASQYSLYLEDTKFIINIGDINHRENIEFPEVVDSSEFQRKDDIFRKSLPRALAIFTNASIIKERISFFYGILKERIFLVNLHPSNPIKNFKNIDKEKQLKVREIHKLPKNYIFYPAMYLPHKNHKNLIDALKILKLNFKPDLKIVFCGNDNDVNYLKNLKTYVNKNNLNDSVTFLNFVDDDHLPYLYLDAFLLAMPTLMGPTNIPPLEAFKMEVPVIYSELEGIKEVFGDAVLYIDPLKPESIANGIKEIFQNTELKNNLIIKGKKRLDQIDYKTEFEQFFKIIKEYRKLKQVWEFDS